MTQNRKDTQDFVYKLFASMQDDDLAYIYRGSFDQGITDNILLLTESNLQKKEESSKVKKRIYSILVEGLQNITRHQDQDNKEVDSQNAFGIFVIQKNNNKYYITTGNLIDNDNISSITKLLEKINSLDKASLKEYYKEVLEEGSLSEKGGAGLGLIDMARKANSKLIYDFKKINQKYSYFYLHTVPSVQKDEQTDSYSTDSLNNIESVHKSLNQAFVRLVFSGLFNQDSLLDLLATIKGQIAGTASIKNKVFYIIVEMLQNVIKHGAKLKESNGNPGIFYISEEDNHYIITTGNYISNGKIDKLKNKLEEVNILNLEELDNFYIKSLFNFEIDDSKESGLGIIDLRIKSENKLNFYFFKVNEKHSFYTLQTKVKMK